MPAGATRNRLQAHLYSEKEKDCAYSCLFTPVGEQQLRAWSMQIAANPIPLDQLQTALCHAVPDLHQFYIDHPTAPPLFHVEETLARLDRAHHRGIYTVDVVWLQLMCLKSEIPYPTLSVQAPPGPTTDYCVELDSYLEEQDVVLHISETARMCLSPFLDAYAERNQLQLQNIQPTKFMLADICGISRRTTIATADSVPESVSAPDAPFKNPTNLRTVLMEDDVGTMSNLLEDAGFLSGDEDANKIRSLFRRGIAALQLRQEILELPMTDKSLAAELEKLVSESLPFLSVKEVETLLRLCQSSYLDKKTRVQRILKEWRRIEDAAMDAAAAAATQVSTAAPLLAPPSSSDNPSLPSDSARRLSAGSPLAHTAAQTALVCAPPFEAPAASPAPDIQREDLVDQSDEPSTLEREISSLQIEHDAFQGKDEAQEAEEEQVANDEAPLRPGDFIEVHNNSATRLGELQSHPQLHGGQTDRVILIAQCSRDCPDILATFDVRIRIFLGTLDQKCDLKIFGASLMSFSVAGKEDLVSLDLVFKTVNQHNFYGPELRQAVAAAKEKAFKQVLTM
ncbi:hypothetical protein RHOSPDRAFT_34522 [Rhodotorula sp. JG-1b]|nr:hypothetical protein RHOSPDRAFT_34522 [Rhodotorula sp. JG-1b]